MTDRNAEPPFLLDGTQVVRYAVIDTSVPPPPHFSVVAGGVPMDLHTVSRLIVAEDLVKGGVYLAMPSGRRSPPSLFPTLTRRRRAPNRAMPRSRPNGIAIGRSPSPSNARSR
jgi:hypothetical protein